MSKRSSSFQISKDSPDSGRDEAQDTAKKATAKTMSNRRILNPRSRRRPGGGDLSAIGNPFAPVDPNVNSGSPSPAETNANPFSNITFGGGSQSQSFPAPTFGGTDQNSGSQASSFPPPQTASSNIFSNLNGSSSGFTFGGGSAANNPFSKVTQPSLSPQPPASTPKFNFLQSSSQNETAPSHNSTIFGQSSQPSVTKQPNGNNIFGTVPVTPSASNSQGSPAPQQGSYSTSPNDMDMASPPSTNKFSNPLAAGITSTSTAAPLPSSNLFSNIGKGLTAKTNANAGAQPSLFGATGLGAIKPADPPSSSNNIFNNLSKSSQQSSPSAPQTGSLFGDSNKSVEKTSQQGLSSSNMPSSQPSAPVQSGKLFGSTVATSAAAESADQSAATGQSRPNLFASASAGENSSLDMSTPSSMPPSLFPSTPKPPSSILDAAANPTFGQNVPKTAPSKASGQYDTSQFAEAYARPLQGQGAPHTRSESASVLFPSSVHQDAPSESTQPTNGASTGAAQPALQPSSHSTFPATMFGTSSPGHTAQAQQLKLLNENVRRAILRLNTSTDWTVALVGLSDIYKATVQVMEAKSDQTGPGNAVGGKKRKEQADPPEEAPRASKQLNTESTSSHFPASKEQATLPSSSSLFAPARSDGNLSSTSLFPLPNKSSSNTPAPSLFPSNNEQTSNTAAPSLFPSQNGQISTASTPSLFAPQKEQVSSSPMPSLFVSHDEQPSTAPTPSLFAPAKSTSERSPPKSLFTPGKAQSNTSKLFQDIVENGDSPGSPADASPSQHKTSTTPDAGLFGHYTSNNVLGNANGAKSSLFGQTTGAGAFGSPKPASSNMFGHLSKGHDAQNEDEGSEDGEAIEDALRNNSHTPPPASSGKSLFERISGGPPIREADGESGVADTASAANDADENGEAPSSHGDHTWKPETTIKFGESISSNSSAMNGNLFGQNRAPPSSLFGKSSTPAASPFKASENNLFGSTLKPATNTSSRATTPGTDINGASGVSASEAEDGSARQEDGVAEGEVTADKSALSAEEQGKEEVIFEVPKLKMIQFNPEGRAPRPGYEHEEKDTRWNTRGTGSFHVLKNKETGAIRLLHRIAPRGTVLINSPVLERAAFKKLPGKGTALIGALGLAADGTKEMTFQNWTARMASDETAKELIKVLESNRREE